MTASQARPLVFLSDTGANALEGLVRQLEQRGLQAEHLLRLRAFLATGDRASVFLRDLEQLLSRERWPALTVVQASNNDEQMEVLDAIAASKAGERRIVRDGTVRFGDWVFVGARRGEGEDIERQAHSVFKRMHTALARAGAQLRHVVKVGGWLAFSMSEYEPLGRVRSELVEHGLLPASAAVQVGAINPFEAPEDEAAARHPRAWPAPPAGADIDEPGPLLAFEAIAFTGAGPRVSGRISPLAPFYTSACSAGGYVFTCGEIPRAGGSAGEQLRDVYEQLEGHLGKHGATLTNALAQTIYVRSGHDPRAVAGEAQSLLAPTEPSTTVVTVSDMGFRPGVDVEVELVAHT